MKLNSALPQDKKLTVLFRVESGCLGPTGEEHIEDFCLFAEKELKVVDANYMNWMITPRHDKSEPEIEYKVNNKNLSHDKAAKYLGIFDKNLDDVEERLHDKLSILIDQHLS